MSASINLVEYLFTRLRQLGVSAIHGVPGDYNLELLDYVKPSGLVWVGNANELNAAYAADGYARIKGIGAVVTTFGVGELSAISAIAGSYAEFAPVVHILGTPPRASQDGRLLIRHTFADGEYGRFAQMNSHVTVAQTSLWDPQTSAQQIDTVLQECLLHSRPSTSTRGPGQCESSLGPTEDTDQYFGGWAGCSSCLGHSFGKDY